MKRQILNSLIVSNLVLLSACGGGSSDGVSTSSTTVASANYTIKGTVPGTLIEAFCDNGAYYSTTSIQNGTNQHPFEITLPANLGCNLVMTTNENDPANSIVTPIGFFDANGDIQTRVSAGSDALIDLGFVSLFIDRAQTGGFDLDDDGVIDTPQDGGTHDGLVVQSGNNTLDPDGDGIIEPYDDEDDDGILNRDDGDYSKRNTDTDRDGLVDSIDVNPNNDDTASNTYPTTLDSDGDGYLDEDKDKDGYYDDDFNRDGFHEDDSDHDGFHDDDLDHDGQHDESKETGDSDSDDRR